MIVCVHQVFEGGDTAQVYFVDTVALRNVVLSIPLSALGWAEKLETEENIIGFGNWDEVPTVDLPLNVDRFVTLWEKE